ncbi:MAG: hypothetical protein OXF23_00595 [Candidatus Dadabacteria bacterium]|nr:hypothetical protein [Candidatus Dadabacteria bacterium]
MSSSVWKRITGWVAETGTRELIVTLFGWAFAAPAVFTVIAFLQEVPLAWIFLGAALLFYHGIFGMNWYEERKVRNNIKDRVAFSRVNFNKGYGFVRIGVEIENKSVFPIWFQVARMRSKFNGVASPNENRTGKPCRIASQQAGWADDFNIETGITLDGTYEGEVECEIEFWREGKAKNTMKINQAVWVIIEGQEFRYGWRDQ